MHHGGRIDASAATAAARWTDHQQIVGGEFDDAVLVLQPDLDLSVSQKELRNAPGRVERDRVGQRDQQRRVLIGVLRRRNRAGLDDVKLAANQRVAIFIKLLRQAQVDSTSHAE